MKVKTRTAMTRAKYWRSFIVAVAGVLFFFFYLEVVWIGEFSKKN